MKEGTITVGGITYVWNLEPHEIDGGNEQVIEGLRLICNARPIGFIRDKTGHSGPMAGWYGEANPYGSGTTYTTHDLEALIRRIVATHHEISHLQTMELSAYATDPAADHFDVFELGTSIRIGRILRISDQDWHAYLTDIRPEDPIRSKSLRAALDSLAGQNLDPLS